MTQAKTPTRQRRPKEETRRLGEVVYERDIRARVEADHHGKVIAIDVDSGEYAIAENARVAGQRLRAETPGR